MLHSSHSGGATRSPACGPPALVSSSSSGASLSRSGHDDDGRLGRIVDDHGLAIGWRCSKSTISSSGCEKPARRHPGGGAQRQVGDAASGGAERRAEPAASGASQPLATAQDDWRGLSARRSTTGACHPRPDEDSIQRLEPAQPRREGAQALDRVCAAWISAARHAGGHRLAHCGGMARAMLEFMSSGRTAKAPRRRALGHPKKKTGPQSRSMDSRARPFDEATSRLPATPMQIVHSIGSFLTVWTSVATSADAAPPEPVPRDRVRPIGAGGAAGERGAGSGCRLSGGAPSGGAIQSGGSGTKAAAGRERAQRSCEQAGAWECPRRAGAGARTSGP